MSAAMAALAEGVHMGVLLGGSPVRGPRRGPCARRRIRWRALKRRAAGGATRRTAVFAGGGAGPGPVLSLGRPRRQNDRAFPEEEGSS